MGILAAELPGARVLDLYAGSGALGLEALSRGAASAEFVELGRASLAALRRNLDALGVGDRARVHRGDALRFAERLPPGACDLAYAASDAALSHPVLRFVGLPDFAWFPVFLAPRHAMELHLTGRVYAGEEAARIGLVNQAFPAAELEARVLQIAQTIAETPPAVVTVNKRYVYTALEARGGRSVIRTGADLQAGPHLQGLGASGAELSAKIKAAQKKG